jgi:hypothetical protein
MLNFEVPYTAARRLIKYPGTNPASIYDLYKWKERMTYPGSVQASDPEGWSIISPTNNPDLPVWLQGGLPNERIHWNKNEKNKICVDKTPGSCLMV